jgi:hypothetical protein
VTDLECAVHLKREILPQMMKIVCLSWMMGKLVIEIGDKHIISSANGNHEVGLEVLQKINDACCVNDKETSNMDSFETCMRSPFLDLNEQVSCLYCGCFVRMLA